MSDMKYRTLAYITTLVAISVAATVGYLIGGYALSGLLILALIIGLILFRPILRPKQGNVKVAIASITLFATTVGLVLAPDSFTSRIFNLLTGTTSDGLNIEYKIAVLLIVGTVLIIINWIISRRPVIPSVVTLNPEDKDLFAENDYIKLRDRFCLFMCGYLDRLDRETNWSDSEYTTLEAEVEVANNGLRRSRIEPDLIKAVRTDDKSRTFLLIGDPGSGKSVSLRRLVRTLYSDVPNAGLKAVVPLYINLKEWDGPLELSDRDISKFVLRKLKEVSGREGQSFLKNYFNEMLRNGLFFFVFDSFDELPMVLDSDDDSNQVKEISAIFNTFFSDLHACRGLISSRPFRKPRGFNGKVLLIRPFQERQIRKAMKLWLLGEGIDAERVIKRLLSDRPHLSAALRNPFMADLIAQYIKEHRDKFPKTHFDLFNNYITNRLDEDISYLTEKAIGRKEVIVAATEIAKAIFTNEKIGLEIDVSKLLEIIDDEMLLEKMSAIQYCRIARWGGASNDKFSFVHRRFAEYFAVKALIEDDGLIDLESIPTDSRWRDSLVVYCGIASNEKVQELAEFAWGKVKDQFDKLYSGQVVAAKSSVHCLRFLRDACSSRLESIASFLAELSGVSIKLNLSKDPLVVKLSTELTSLVSPHARKLIIVNAFRSEMSYLRETALRSCRNIAMLEPEIVNEIKNYILSLSTYSLLATFFDLRFNLSLSHTLRAVKGFHLGQLISLVLLWICAMSLLFFYALMGNIIEAGVLVFMIVVSEMFVVINVNNKSVYARWFRFREGFDTSIRLAIFSSVPIILKEYLIQWEALEILTIGILLLVVIPWNIWRALYVAIMQEGVRRLLSKTMRTIWEGRMQAIVAIAMLSLFYVLVWMSTKFKILGYILGGFLVAFLLIQFYLGLRSFVVWMRDYWRDRRFLNDLKLSSKISQNKFVTDLFYAKTDWGKLTYIKMIRAGKVGIVDVTDDSIPLFKNVKIQNELTKLREEILGLSE